MSFCDGCYRIVAYDFIDKIIGTSHTFGGILGSRVVSNGNSSVGGGNVRYWGLFGRWGFGLSWARNFLRF